MAVPGLLLLGATPGRAAGMSVGVNTWYSTWDLEPASGMSYDSSLMYGPVLGVDWGKKWSITCVLLTADYKATAEVMGSSFPIHFRRYDSDTTLNYTVLKWLKVFGGIKYMRYDTRKTGESVPVFGSSDNRHYTYGPGLGIGLTLPISDSLFALVNVSGMYLTGRASENLVENYNLTETGINTTASIAFYAESIATTFAIGVRYQYFKSDPDIAGGVTSDLTFYGITFSAVHHFSLGGKE